MFGMGFMEIMLILIVAVIALGPEKLPTAAVDIAKFLKKMKSSVDDAKSTINSEISKTGLREEASNFKDNMGIDRLANLNLDNLIEDDDDDFDTKPAKVKKVEKTTQADYSTTKIMKKEV
jgi:sec-independent protein translocase protein TatB